MKGRDFYDAVHAIDELVWHGVLEADGNEPDRVIVEYAPHKAKFSIPIHTIGQHEWDELRDVITGKRRPNIMEHITRIVGYYSDLQNWNRSKIAELADRHKGDYGVQPKDTDNLSLDYTPVVPRFAAQPDDALVAA